MELKLYDIGFNCWFFMIVVDLVVVWVDCLIEINVVDF